MVRRFNELRDFKNEFDSVQRKNKISSFCSYHASKNKDLAIWTILWTNSENIPIELGYLGPITLNKTELTRLLKEINSEELKRFEEVSKVFH